jgi:uncharacterized protein YbcI
VFDPDIAIEIFVLDRPPAGENPRSDADVRSAKLRHPGSVGDADALPGRSITAEVSQVRRSPSTAPEGEGRVRAALGNAMMRLTNTYWGRGPTRAKAVLKDDFLFCMLEEPLTTVERTLAEAGQTLLVRHARIELQDLVNPEYAAQVERILGRRVVACHSQILFDPDVLVLVFVLESGDATGHGLSSENADIEAPAAGQSSSPEVSDRP